ncbi:hypothetical protein IKF40_00860 [Candidatus Saccharibacteria bacterium]|nr:hypothetical protein [Candidatus Saccharibacteria bacterium]
MSEVFNFNSNDIKPNDGFGPQSSSTQQPQSAQPQSLPQPEQPQPPIAPLATNASPKNTLIFIIVGLGVLTLVLATVCVWLIVDKTKTTTPEIAATKTSETTTESTEITAKTLGFFPKKIKNPADGVTYRLGVHRTNSSGNGVFGAYINTENSGVELYIYWEFIGNYYGVDTGGKTNRQLAHIAFDQPIADITLGESGQTVGGDVLLFLMQDGSVEYMPIVKALRENRFESYGKMGGLSDIVKFYRTDAIDGNGDFSGYITTLAQKTNGEIIDLQGFLRSAVTPSE